VKSHYVGPADGLQQPVTQQVIDVVVDQVLILDAARFLEVGAVRRHEDRGRLPEGGLAFQLASAGRRGIAAGDLPEQAVRLFPGRVRSPGTAMRSNRNPSHPAANPLLKKMDRPPLLSANAEAG